MHSYSINLMVWLMLMHFNFGLFSNNGFILLSYDSVVSSFLVPHLDVKIFKSGVVTLFSPFITI